MTARRAGGRRAVRRRALAAAGAAVAALAAPAVARATTYSVAAGGGTCGGGDETCESLSAASGAVASGDSVLVAPGIYAEAPAFPVAGVTITGSTAGAGVIVTGTITFAGSGATPSVLEKVVVAPSAIGAPAVGVTGSAGVAVRDAFLLSAGGPGIAIAGGGNEITRSTVLSGTTDGRAVDVQVATTPVNLVLSSSVLGGGSAGTGLSVRTGVDTPLPGSAAPATVVARHVTIAGAADAVALDASSAVGLLATAAGNISATVTDSILHGATPRATNPGLVLVAAPNSASLTLTRTDRATPDGQLFVNPGRRNYHLRADAPLIDKGQLTPGDSATDVDGQPRETGAASDLGADEFINTPPSAAIAVTTPNPRANQPVGFDASGSVDREAGVGGGIVEYRWTFGDGTTETTSAPAVSHTYGDSGVVAVGLVVVDRQGAASAAATAGVTIFDGSAPMVTVAFPRSGQRLRIFTTRTRTVTRDGRRRTRTTRTRNRVGFAGTARDPSGVATVYMTLQRLSSAKRTSASRCSWLDPRRGLVRRACDRPILIRARLRASRWAYLVARGIRLGAGRYRVSVYGSDRAGAFGNTAPTRDRVVRFAIGR